MFCCSNAIRETIIRSLRAIGVLDCFDSVFSSTEDAGKQPKPSPAVYLRAMASAGLSARQVLIVEDSPIGRRAARLSGAHVLPVGGPADVTAAALEAAIQEAERRNRAGLPPAGPGPEEAPDGLEGGGSLSES